MSDYYSNMFCVESGRDLNFYVKVFREFFCWEMLVWMMNLTINKNGWDRRKIDVEFFRFNLLLDLNGEVREEGKFKNFVLRTQV